MKKTFPAGHVFEKTSDCPVCPFCEKIKNTSLFFIPSLAAPARRAMENAGITSIEKLTLFSERELLQLHGFGKSSLPHLYVQLKAQGLSLKKENTDGKTHNN